MATEFITQTLWLSLEQKLNRFACELKTTESELVFQVGRSSNDAFPLRAYAAVNLPPDGIEISIVVDAVFELGGIALTSDACSESGQILQGGPETIFPSDADRDSMEVILAKWSLDFDEFLQVAKPKVLSALSAPSG